MNFYEETGIPVYINAHDTYTVYGGSRMSEETLNAMNEASRSFVDITVMQKILGEKLAEMTGNEGAYLTNGAAGALVTATAVCMARGSMFAFSRLPALTPETKSEAVIMRCQHNAYDKAIEEAGAKPVYIGDADETLEFELEGVLSEKTAAVYYFVSTLYERASLSLEKTIEIAHKHEVPVIVDAAAQFPPVENFSRFTKMGADLVIFSGGKTLRGPQDSGIIVGRKSMIEDCIRFGAPNHGVCRACKSSREAMAGLYSAIKQYLALDQEANTAHLRMIDRKIQKAFESGRNVTRTEIVERGPVGQTYPRIFAYMQTADQAVRVHDRMLDKRIYTGLDKQLRAVYISPLNLNEEEVEIVIQALMEVLE